MYICKIFTNLNVKEYFYNIMQDRCNACANLIFFFPYITLYFYIYINFVDFSS